MTSAVFAPATKPVTVLTGFLGSGKTTLLRRLLADPATRDTAVLVNELGEIALDHDLVRSVREDLVVLASGCVCCSVRNDLVRALAELHVKAERGEVPPFRRVVVETTGLADPTPLLHTLAKNGLVRHLYHLAAVVTTVDASLGAQTLAAHLESVKQVAVADRLVMTKTDLATPLERGRLEALLAPMNPLASRHDTSHAGLGADILAEAPAHPHAPRWGAPSAAVGRDGDGPHETGPDEADRHAHAHAHAHGGDVRTFSDAFDQPVDFRAFALWLSLQTQVHGEHLLRVKGILHAVGEAAPIVVQSVQHVVYPVASLDAWPFRPPASRVVAIARGLEPGLFAALRESLRAALAPSPGAW